MRHELVHLCSQLSRRLLALTHCLLLLTDLTYLLLFAAYSCFDCSAWLILLNAEISPLIVELRGLVREHLVQGFSFVFNMVLASIASESNNSVSVRCSGNVFSFLGNTLILFLASGCSGKTLIEPLPGNGCLCCFLSSIFLLLGIVYRALLSNGLYQAVV
jgi:hypothetical protein